MRSGTDVSCSALLGDNLSAAAGPEICTGYAACELSNTSGSRTIRE